MNTTETIIPQLFIRKGRALLQILPDQCGPLMAKYRNGRGVSEMRKPEINLCDIDGNAIGYISYNGRAWLGDCNKTEHEDRVEIPQAGIKTAAQREAEGWR